MKPTNAPTTIRCAHCGGSRLLPLTVHFPLAEHLATRRLTRPVRAELKCIVCGHRRVAHPRVLLPG